VAIAEAACVRWALATSVAKVHGAAQCWDLVISSVAPVKGPRFPIQCVMDDYGRERFAVVHGNWLPRRHWGIPQGNRVRQSECDDGSK